MDGVDAFHAGYQHGQVTTPPTEYADLILVPAILHTPTAQFWELPWIVQEKARRLLKTYIAAGWAGNPQLIQRDARGRD
jgi:hypothetical protein